MVSEQEEDHGPGRRTFMEESNITERLKMTSPEDCPFVPGKQAKTCF